MNDKQIELIECIKHILTYNKDPETELAKLDINTNILKNIQFSLDAVQTEITYV